MALAVTLREHNTLANDNAPSSRGEVLARYRHLREISKRHHHEVLQFMSGDALFCIRHAGGMAPARDRQPGFERRMAWPRRRLQPGFLHLYCFVQARRAAMTPATLKGRKRIMRLHRMMSVVALAGLVVSSAAAQTSDSSIAVEGGKIVSAPTDVAGVSVYKAVTRKRTPTTPCESRRALPNWLQITSSRRRSTTVSSRGLCCASRKGSALWWMSTTTLTRRSCCTGTAK